MSWRVIDGFNKSINIFISPREPGKTDTTWWEKIYSNWYDSKKPWVYLVRQVVEITDALISDIENTIINKWSIEPVELQYNKGDCKSGIVDVKIKGQLFIRIVALSIQLRRIKLAKIPNIAGIFMDEYIIDPKTQEKYLPNEYFKIKELYTTYRREYTGKGMLKMYFCGNPYSLYNPLFMGLGINVSQLKKDEYKFIDGEYKLIHHIYVGEEFAVEWGVLHPELKKMLLEKNPFYKIGDSMRDIRSFIRMKSPLLSYSSNERTRHFDISASNNSCILATSFFPNTMALISKFKKKLRISMFAVP